MDAKFTGFQRKSIAEILGGKPAESQQPMPLNLNGTFRRKSLTEILGGSQEDPSFTGPFTRKAPESFMMRNPNFPVPSGFNGQGNPMPILRGNKATLSDEEIANIIFNESISLTGPGIDLARKAIANAIMNGNESLGGSRPKTAEKFIERFINSDERKELNRIKVMIVPEVRAERARGMDSSEGAMHFNFRGLKTFPKGGLDAILTMENNTFRALPDLILGPLDISAPGCHL